MSAGLDRDAISCCKPSDNSLTESERMADLSHIDKHGRARMVDVGDKPVTARKASATGIVTCQLLTLDLLKESKVPKGNVIGTAELAGVMAAKRTADLIPLCHQIPLSQVDVTITADDTLPGFAVTATVRTEGRTGAEMEALTAVTTAALTIYDMCKAIDRGMQIHDICLVEKSGGKSGSYYKP